MNSPTAVASRSSSLASVFRLEAFRGIWIASVLAGIATGTSRFAFIWLIGDLTSWDPAVAVLGVVIGLPALLLSAHAGALADRLAPRRFGAALLVSTTVLFAATALLTPTSLMTVPVVLVCAFCSAAPVAGITPLFQALVPVVVPRDHLLPAIALQNMGMMSSVILGAFLGGGVIALFGIAAGFWVITASSGLAAIQYCRTPLPPKPPSTDNHRGAVRAGMRVALRTEPLRSLLGLTFVVGLATTAVTLLLPAMARDVLHVGSFKAGLFNAAMGIGMMVVSLVVAARIAPRRPGRLLTTLLVSTLGSGLVLVGLSQNYAFWLAVILCWGAIGGVTMALLRALMQEHTPPAMMGRVMGLSALALQGAFPLGSVVLFVLVQATNLSSAMVIAGVLCTIAVAAIATRPHVRQL
ncbi:MAG TPA: MFS transporter [Ilumatobacteraceae bacterium]|nr:MFS transporter [Ilumatobacteraceae bacterium]